jgi:hypothetical protein
VRCFQYVPRGDKQSKQQQIWQNQPHQLY